MTDDNDGYSVIGGGESSSIEGVYSRVNNIKAVEIRAELRQVKSMVDGTFNIVLNIPEDCREQVKKMIDWLALEVRAVVVCEDYTKLYDEINKDPKDRASKVDRRRIGKRRDK